MASTSYSKIPLSTSISGKQILVSGTASGSAMAIHTSASDTNLLDEIYLYAYNDATSSVQCSVLWGGTSEPTNVNRTIIPSRSGRVLIVDGKLLQNGTVYAYAQAPNVIALDGFVNRITSGSFNVIDPFVTSWANRVVNNSGSLPSINTQIALTTFYNSLSANNILQKMITINCFVSDSFSASLTPLMFCGSDPLSNTAFTSASLTINGIAGNGSTTFLDTGINLNSSIFSTKQYNLGYTFYAYSVNASGFDYGAYSTTGLMGAAKHTDNNTYAYNGTVATNVILLASPGAGYYSDNRISSIDHRLYFANSSTTHAQIGSTDAVSFTGFMPSQTLYIGATRFPTLQYPSSTRISFAALHIGLTSTESQTFFNAIQTLRQNLGGGYV